MEWHVTQLNSHPVSLPGCSICTEPVTKVLYLLLSRIWMCAQSLIRVRLFTTPWTVAHQASLPMEFPRQEYWSRLPFPTPGDLPKPGIKPTSLASIALAGRFLKNAQVQKPKSKSWTLFHHQSQ